MFADIGDFIGLLIFVLIAIISTLFKRKEKSEQETFELPPELKPRRREQPPPVVHSWEEELRRLLEERPSPPPVVQHAPAPPPIHVPPPAPQHSWNVPQSHQPRPAPTPPPARHPESAFAAPGEVCEPEDGLAGAAHLTERVAHHLAEVTRHRVALTQVRHSSVSPEVARARELVRSPHGARAAIISSIILGPPRALEES